MVTLDLDYEEANIVKTALRRYYEDLREVVGYGPYNDRPTPAQEELAQTLLSLQEKL